MKSKKSISPSAVLPCLAVAAATVGVGHAAVVITGEFATVPYSQSPWANTISATDLVNSGQSSLAGTTVSAVHGSFAKAGVNDGSGKDGSTSENTFFKSDEHFPAVVTFDLDVTTNTRGYDIISISSFMGWVPNSMAQANQTYTVEVSKVGSTGYTTLATISYTPFEDKDDTAHETRVQITEDSNGALASGVDSIRFTFADPKDTGVGTGEKLGTVIRELDVFGSATVPEPSVAMLGGLGLLGLLLRRR